MSKALVPRRFSSQEVARILRRAAELELADPTGRTPSAMSVDDVERLAGEAGIEPARVRAAIAELHGRDRGPRGSVLLGAPTHIYLERIVPVGIPADALEELLAEIRSVLKETGAVSLIGGTLTFSTTPVSQGSVVPIHVVITRRERETRLVVEARLGNLAGGLLGGIGGGGGGG